tara:strand:+ start:931 stop:1728 length:798 start_codon:yes stop_codon:yes gene_type:complete
MALEITHLGSGSRGNCAIINSDETRVMIDCGFSIKQTEKRLGSLELKPRDIDAIIVTHHHQDHSKSAMGASKKWNIPLYCNQFTAKKMNWEFERCKIFDNLERVDISSKLSILPIPIPHDDSDNIAVIASDKNNERAAIVTDLGEATDELIKHLEGCGHISIEANYDNSRLMNGPYPDILKRRITGRGGHLSNEQTSEILERVCHPKLESIVLCHLSEKNNAPHMAESEVLMRIDEKFLGEIAISSQTGPEFTHFLGDGKEILTI